MADAQRSRQRLISEDDFTQAVVDLARLRGWQVCHFRPCRTGKGWRTAVQGHKGFPDIALARDGVVILAELKAENGRLSPEQVAWATAISTIHYRLWKPSDMPAIIEELT